ncbi:MAG: hypothetical protein H6511_04370 [Holophagales bacterium]|nr:hypothetical protein [Holophagales bacterium]
MRRTAPIVIALALAVPACRPSDANVAEARPAIEQTLSAYAEKLAEAYRTGDPRPLAEVATEREILRVGAQIQELNAAGKELHVELVLQAVESLDLYKSNAATVQTVETWKLQVRALGSGAILSESPEQENRVVYSLIREEGRWRILSRILKQTNEP